MTDKINYSKLRSLSVRKIILALIKDNFYLAEQSGSHQQYRHPDGRRVTVTFHHSGDTFKPKTLKSMVEIQAKWSKEDLIRLKLISE